MQENNINRRKFFTKTATFLGAGSLAGLGCLGASASGLEPIKDSEFSGVLNTDVNPEINERNNFICQIVTEPMRVYLEMTSLLRKVLTYRTSDENLEYPIYENEVPHLNVSLYDGSYPFLPREFMLTYSKESINNTFDVALDSISFPEKHFEEFGTHLLCADKISETYSRDMVREENNILANVLTKAPNILSRGNTNRTGQLLSNIKDFGPGICIIHPDDLLMLVKNELSYVKFPCRREMDWMGVKAYYDLRKEVDSQVEVMKFYTTEFMERHSAFLIKDSIGDLIMRQDLTVLPYTLQSGCRYGFICFETIGVAVTRPENVIRVEYDLETS